jgi:HK97 family phage prohead protease
VGRDARRTLNIEWESLKKRAYPVQLLWQHQWEQQIGVITQIFEDKHGLYVEGQLLLEVARAKEAHALLKAGALRGMSIGYTVKKSRRDVETGARELLAVELWEVSLVTLPANMAAQVTVVKAADMFAALDVALKQAETTLRLPN